MTTGCNDDCPTCLAAFDADERNSERVLLRFARVTEVITAEHHPREHGMKYVLYIEGGRYSGTVIHCATEASVTELFNQVVAARKSGCLHPYLMAV